MYGMRLTRSGARKVDLMLMFVPWLFLLVPFLTASTPRIDFNRDIRPILSDKCFACHGPDDGQRQAGLRLDTRDGVFAERDKGTIIVRGNRSSSRLYQRISHEIEVARMPPPAAERKLTSEEIERIGIWIDQGAAWEAHWAYMPPKRVVLPEVSDKTWSRTPIDRFVLARLEHEGLRPSKAAGKATLLRRLSLDLTGLPPTPEQVAAFMADDGPNAYEKRVDELLRSPHYGEKMAMPWLDAARYADTHGYHVDSHREMWRWRDWVIEAFNDNMPFDRFTVEQLAGDLLPDATPSQILATGFNRNHMINFEGGSIPEEFQVEYVVDRIETTSTVWMATTMGCARCHDHKYDPFKQKEFYQFFAFFNTVSERGLDGWTGNAVPVLELPSDSQERKRQELQERIKAIEVKLSDQEIKPRQAVWEKTALDTVPSAPENGLVARWSFEGNLLEQVERQVGKTVRGELTYKKYGLLDQAVSFSGQTHAEMSTAFIPRRNEPFSIAVWFSAADFNRMHVLHKIEDTETRRGFELLVDDFIKIGQPYELKRGQRIRVRLTHQWPDNVLEVRTVRHIETFDQSQPAWHHLTVTYDGSGKAAGLHLYVDGKPEEIDTISDTLSGPIRNDQPFATGGKEVGPAFLGGFDEMRVYSRVLGSSEVANLSDDHPIRSMLENPLQDCPEYFWRGKQTGEGGQPQIEDDKGASRRMRAECGRRQNSLRDYFLSHVATENEQQSYGELLDLDKRLTRLKNEIPTTMVMSEMSTPRETFVLGRGDYRNKTMKVTAGIPAVLNPLPAMAKPNRLGLAYWLVDPANPLTARVTVNRYWQMIFGTGLVRTSEDFGSQGEPPSHPDLLDWLAVEFIESSWDVKALLKKVVMSSVYQQSSQVSAKLLERDSGNRLFARGARFRLSAEGIRDNALTISGLLNPEIGGPSVYPYQPPGLWEEMAFGDVWSAQAYTPSSGKDLYRRSMYTFWKRTVPPASLATFDAPDREECRTHRARTNTPLQALVLMNDPTYVEASRHLAQRMITEVGDNSHRRIEFAFRRALGRMPRPEETEVLLAIAREQEIDYRKAPKAAHEIIAVGESEYDSQFDPVELAAWTVVTGTILNLDEVITKE